jgi:hypothetical protein
MRVRVTIVALQKHGIFLDRSVSVALVIQHAVRMRVIILSLWPVWLYQSFPHFLINFRIFGKKVIGPKICILSFSTTLV